VLGSVVRRAMSILVPYYCQRPVSFDVVAAVHRGDPPADQRTWKSHPITRHLRQCAGCTRRRYRKSNGSSGKSVYTPLSPSQSAPIFRRSLWDARLSVTTVPSRSGRASGPSPLAPLSPRLLFSRDVFPVLSRPPGSDPQVSPRVLGRLFQVPPSCVLLRLCPTYVGPHPRCHPIPDPLHSFSARPHPVGGLRCLEFRA